MKHSTKRNLVNLTAVAVITAVTVLSSPTPKAQVDWMGWIDRGINWVITQAEQFGQSMQPTNPPPPTTPGTSPTGEGSGDAGGGGNGF